ncbi:MarR family transcriptional regulator [Sphingobium cupriresistens]|uniref:MarR family transcriptional regulator n=1 Tax=Sphingobium cupriresistens TaxID=1132417 RepID=UPI003BADF06A
MSDLFDQAVAFVRSPLYIEMTARQMAIIGVAMQDAEPVRVRDMAKRLGVAKPIVTRALNTLERHGFVERLRGPDRRDRLINVTDAGRAFRASIGGAA